MIVAAPPAELTSRLRMVTMRLSRLLRQQNGTYRIDHSMLVRAPAQGR